ncbi:MAG: cytochrome d ubiquinol oxidase subunit II [Actinobacteria bacterium]|nr:cytochrome d ubiquinol oxidase subunit II [Actinomycetota bacterium]
MDLQLIWYALIGVLVAGYAVLDGFDLGVGALYPFLPRDEAERLVLRRSIGPVWDGNEVWLLTAGGALFAAFPPVYATVFSGFYLALILVLMGLIFRAVSLEFRSHDPAWARVWDAAFAGGSALPALLLGVAAGNLVRGLPLSDDGEFAGTFLTLLNPFALLVGVFGLVMFVAHGAAWITLKSEGALRDRAARVRSVAHWLFLALLVVVTVATGIVVPDRIRSNLAEPLGWVALAMLVAGLVVARTAMIRGRDRGAFLGSALGIVGLVGLWAVGSFPYLVPGLDGGAGLSAYQESSSDLSLTVMLVAALIGLPVVLAYTALVYRVFRGRIVTEDVVEEEGQAGY